MSNSNEKQCGVCGVPVIPKIIGRTLHCPTCDGSLGELPSEEVPVEVSGSRPVGFGTESTRTKPRRQGWS